MNETANTNARVDRGILTLSLDFELIWGTLDKPKWVEFKKLCAEEREYVIDGLLRAFEEFDVSATWATVGHLMLDRCECHAGRTHASMPRPKHAWRRGDWFDRDPGTCEREDPVFYGRELVRRIQACLAPQEIGCHTFSHVIFGDAGCSREVADADCAAAVAAARELGIQMKSFVFPRNRIGHLNSLVRHGFKYYRGNAAWYDQPDRNKYARMAGHVWDIATAAEPPVVMPRLDSNGLWNIPGSMLYTPSFGVRRHIPVSLRVARAMKGLRKAAETGRIFHLWFHPTDLVVNRRQMIDGLRRILDAAATMRAKRELEILPMGGIVGHVFGEHEQSAAGLRALVEATA